MAKRIVVANHKLLGLRAVATRRLVHVEKLDGKQIRTYSKRQLLVNGLGQRTDVTVGQAAMLGQLAISRAGKLYGIFP